MAENLKSCVVIPAYNAAKTLGPLVRHIRQLKVDAVVVNDGSTDETAQVATASGALVISHLANHGKGVAVRSGFAFAMEKGYDVVVTMDGDGQHDPAELPRLLEEVARDGVAVVVGNRVQERWRMPRVRRWTNEVMSGIVSWMARQDIPDSQCGFRVVRRKALEQMRLSSRHFDIETELLLAASRVGWRISSIPIRTIYDKHPSQIHPLMDGLRFILLIVRYLVVPPRIERAHGV